MIATISCPCAPQAQAGPGNRITKAINKSRSMPQWNVGIDPKSNGNKLLDEFRVDPPHKVKVIWRRSRAGMGARAETGLDSGRHKVGGLGWPVTNDNGAAPRGRMSDRKIREQNARAFFLANPQAMLNGPFGQSLRRR